jgi:hypothetical protein
MGRVESGVVRKLDCENYRKVHVLWWVLLKKGVKYHEKLYHDCWLSKWKCNLGNPKQWVDILFVLFSFATQSNMTINSIVTNNATHGSKVRINFDVVNNYYSPI